MYMIRTYNSVLLPPAKGNGMISATWQYSSSLRGRLWSPTSNPKGKKSSKGTPPTCRIQQMSAKIMQQAPTTQPLLSMPMHQLRIRTHSISVLGRMAICAIVIIISIIDVATGQAGIRFLLLSYQYFEQATNRMQSTVELTSVTCYIIVYTLKPKHTNVLSSGLSCLLYFYEFLVIAILPVAWIHRANASVYPNINVSETNTQYHSDNSCIIYNNYRYYHFEVLNI